MKRLLYFFAFASFFFACKKGSEFGNTKPQTKIFLDKIELTGTDRLNSVVKMHWSGEDVDGYVKGYEFSFDNQNWVYTTRQDSTFKFSINSGSDTTDVSFYVRAIDDKQEKDETPAFLLIPIRNSQPKVAFDEGKRVPDTVFSVFSILWSMSDLDGNETIDSVFIKANNGNWVALPKSCTFASFVPENPMTDGSQNAKIHLNLTADLIASRLGDLRVGQLNQLYIKVRDNAGTFSIPDTCNQFFLRKQSADFLVIDEHVSTATPSPEEVYFPIFANLGVNYDYFDFATHIPPFWDPTMKLWFGLYDKVFWYGEGKEYSTFGNQMYLEMTSLALQSYLNQGGKLIISTKFPARFNVAATAYQSTIFSYSPFDSLSTAPNPNTVRIPQDSLIYPVNGFSSSFPTLRSSSFLTAVDPGYAKNPLQNLYQAKLQKGASWYGPSAICGTSKYTNGKTNQVFFTVELHKLNGDAANYELMWSKLLKEELAW